ncbi:MAG: signal peptidase II [Candidatus Nanoarchaeia archaeon]|jgi:signal peptidase II
MEKAFKAGLIAIVLIAIDQLVKVLLAGKKYLIGSYGIEYVENHGAAFGILQGWRWALILASIAVLIFIAFLYFKEKNKLEKAAFVLIFAGTCGNLIDRVMLGYVRDFIAVGAWPNFNIADSLNVIGALILIYVLVRKK